MSVVGIRFTLAGGNVDFYDDEIQDITLKYSQSVQVQENQLMAPYFYRESDTWAGLTIAFIEKYSTTRAKIEELIDEKKEMTCYYDYAYSGGTNFLTVMHVPDRTLKTYHYYLGELGADVIHNLTFLQSS